MYYTKCDTPFIPYENEMLFTKCYNESAGNVITKLSNQRMVESAYCFNSVSLLVSGIKTALQPIAEYIKIIQNNTQNNKTHKSGLFLITEHHP